MLLTVGVELIFRLHGFTADDAHVTVYHLHAQTNLIVDRKDYCTKFEVTL